MLRHLDGPDKDILTKEEVTAYLRIDVQQLDRLIRKGEFPKGVPYGDVKLPVWYWEDCWAFRHLRMRLHGAPDLPAATPEEN